MRQTFRKLSKSLLQDFPEPLTWTAIPSEKARIHSLPQTDRSKEVILNGMSWKSWKSVLEGQFLKGCDEQ